MKKTVVLFTMALLALAGCKNAEKEQSEIHQPVETVNNNAHDGHYAANSLDWAGVYQGSRPCADCEEIETELKLNKDQTFVLTQTYKGKPEGENVVRENGSFSWEENGSEIVLKLGDKTIEFKVEENRVLMRGMEGDVVDDELAEFYILEKTSE